MSVVGKRIQQHEHVVIGCVVCLNQQGKKVPAFTVVNSYAVCEAHVQLVSQPMFDIFSLRAGKPSPKSPA